MSEPAPEPAPTSVLLHAAGDPPRASATGVAFVLGGALLFSAKAVVVKLCFPYGVDPLTLIALRMALALPFFAVLSAIEEWRWVRSGRPPIQPRDVGVVAVLGALGYYGASTLDFYGLFDVSAGLERLVLFAYPTLTVLISWGWLGRRPTRRELVALGLTYAGIAVAVAEGVGARGAHVLRGTLFVAASALSYALYLVGSGRVVARLGATRLVAHAMTVSCALVLAHFASARPWSALAVPAPVLGYGAVLAVACTVIPTLLQGHGIRRVGASQAAILGSVGPVSTIALAALLLGERPTWIEISGMLLVLLGVAQLGRR